MIVYLNGRQIVVESNPIWALPYWRARQLVNPNITWRIL
jgi:hypothetical protein